MSTVSYLAKALKKIYQIQIPYSLPVFLLENIHQLCCCSLAHVQLFLTAWTAACQASLSFTISQSLIKFMSIESVILSNHLIFCHTLLLLPSIFSRIRVFSNESALCIRWPNYWTFSFSISASNECSVLISWEPQILNYSIEPQAVLTSVMSLQSIVLYLPLSIYGLP